MSNPIHDVLFLIDLWTEITSHLISQNDIHGLPLVCKQWLSLTKSNRRISDLYYKHLLSINREKIINGYLIKGNIICGKDRWIGHEWHECLLFHPSKQCIVQSCDYQNCEWFHPHDCMQFIDCNSKYCIRIHTKDDCIKYWYGKCNKGDVCKYRHTQISGEGYLILREQQWVDNGKWLNLNGEKVYE
jgi:hypothetical protein